MDRSRRPHGPAILLLGLLVAGLAIGPGTATATHGGPHLLDPDLQVRTVTTGLVTPATFAFLDPNQMLVTEKNTGRVARIVNGALAGYALDLAVNFGSERGLLGIEVHPGFPAQPFVYLYWTESTTGADTNNLTAVDLLGNRVDRFRWDSASSTLAFDRNIVRIRARQNDAGQPERGNHDGGVLEFGADGKLYIIIGDLGRRGWMQNLPCGPTPTCPGPTVPDDQYGGPEPDDAHMSGVILRLNDDGGTPSDNPFAGVNVASSAEANANIHKIYAYGVRNSFGMALDPYSGAIWEQENGDDTFSELNRVEPGMNSGWIQIMGPSVRVPEYRQIETTEFGGALQQIRWPPTNIAMTEEEALSRLLQLPGSRFSDPEFSWRYEVAPGGIGFVKGRGLGPQYEGDLFTGGATENLRAGHLFHFNITGNRRKIAVDDPALEDRVADNFAKYGFDESESLLIGTDFGAVTDIETGPNGNLWLVSITRGSIYEISRR